MLDDAEVTRIHEGAIALAHVAGELLLDGFRGDHGARTKGPGGDLVTEYDERCEALLRDRLARLTPDAALVGEAGGGVMAPS